MGHAAAAEALRLLFPPAPRSARRPPGLVFLGCRLFASCLISSLSFFLLSSIFILSLQLSLYFLNLQSFFPLSPNLLCTLTRVLKDGSAHICAAKSCRPAGTYCSCRRCQPAPISFMNHFLSTFFFFPRVVLPPRCWCSVFSPGDIRNSRYFWHRRRPAWPLVLRRRAQMTP